MSSFVCGVNNCEAILNELVQIPPAGSATHQLHLRWLTDRDSLTSSQVGWAHAKFKFSDNVMFIGENGTYSVQSIWHKLWNLLLVLPSPSTRSPVSTSFYRIKENDDDDTQGRALRVGAEQPSLNWIEIRLFWIPSWAPKGAGETLLGPAEALLNLQICQAQETKIVSHQSAKLFTKASISAEGMIDLPPLHFFSSKKMKRYASFVGHFSRILVVGR